MTGQGCKDHSAQWLSLWRFRSTTQEQEIKKLTETIRGNRKRKKTRKERDEGGEKS